MARPRLTAVAAIAAAMGMAAVTFLASMGLQQPAPSPVGSLELANTTTATTVTPAALPSEAASTAIPGNHATHDSTDDHEGHDDDDD